MTVEPCGTRAAYVRHRRNGEDPCQPCIHAQSAYIKQYRASKPKKVAYPEVDPNAYEKAIQAAALEKDETVIVWRKNNHGIWVHTSIHDPFPDSGHNATKTHCIHGHKFTEANTLITPTGRQCRRCKNDSTSRWMANNPQVLTPEQRARKSERERLRRQERKQTALMSAAGREI